MSRNYCNYTPSVSHGVVFALAVVHDFLCFSFDWRHSLPRTLVSYFGIFVMSLDNDFGDIIKVPLLLLVVLIEIEQFFPL